MTTFQERAEEIITAALRYLYSNLDEADEAFGDGDHWQVDNERIAPIREHEVDELLNALAGATCRIEADEPEPDDGE